MAQINCTVGDLKGNVEKIQESINHAKSLKADLVVFPELAITGYPPQDLLLEKDFVRKNKEMLEGLVANNPGITAIIGFVDYDDKNLYNAAAVLNGNELVHTAYKTLLPTYDVFDESRYFKPETEIRPVELEISGQKILLGVEICEDLWDNDYETKVTDLLSEQGADLIVNISSSPFHVGKGLERENLLREKAIKNSIPIFIVNLVGGQDELIFDGQSLAVDKAGDLIAMGKKFQEDMVITNINLKNGFSQKLAHLPYNRDEEIFGALVLGMHDYFKKTDFEKAVIGLSGGIDSSVTAAVAVEALGKNNVIGLFMSTKFSRQRSKIDAKKLAKNLGIIFIPFSIQDVVDSYKQTLDQPLTSIRENFSISKELDDPVADENLQPRIRGNCSMDISNRLNNLKILVLNTGNKTELALGYCTIYGDMTGGLGVLGDVSKLEVYRLANYINQKSGKHVIPKGILMKKPSPELKRGQFAPFDYKLVSPLVDEIIECRRCKLELIEMGYTQEVVEDTFRRIKKAEYKRRQAPPCLKITPKAFGIGRKMPIVNKHSQ